MRVHRGRMVAVGIAAVAILASIPSVAPTATRKKTAVPFAGSITMTSPSSNDALNKTTTAEWTYKPGTSVRSTSRVDVQVTKNGVSWTTVVSNVPIRDAATAWNTLLTKDHIYDARAIVRGTTIASVVQNVYVDNAIPAVAITSPSESQVLIDNANEDQDATEVTFSVALGNTKLQAFAFDALSGIADVEWWLDKGETSEQQLDAHGANTTYDFFTPLAGFHKLYAVAVDRAGNEQMSKPVTVFTGPGPSALTHLPPECPADNPLAGTDSDPCTAPNDPPASCPLANPADGTLIADPCKDGAPPAPEPSPSTPEVPDSCPVQDNPDPDHVPGDPCSQEPPNPEIPEPSPTASPPDVPDAPDPDAPCSQPTEDDPVPHCSINT